MLRLLCYVMLCYVMLLAHQPPVGQGLLIHEVSRSHTTTHHSRKDSFRRVKSSSQRPLLENIQHSQQTNIHAPGGIRTHNLSKRAAADPHLRPRGHWDRRSGYVVTLYIIICVFKLWLWSAFVFANEVWYHTWVYSFVSLWKMVVTWFVIVPTNVVQCDRD